MKTGYRRYNIDIVSIADSNTPYKWTEQIVLVGATSFAWKHRDVTASCRHVLKATGMTRLQTVPDEALAKQHLLNDECSCGIYVAKEPDMGFDYKSSPVIAAVSAWGAYIEYEMGWRFEHVRLEHLWVEPKKLYNHPPLPADEVAQRLSDFYGVGAEVKTLPNLCCGREHPMDYWQSKDGRSLLVCKMETTHIANALRWLKLTNPEIPHINAQGKSVPYRRSRWAAQWILTFEAELVFRSPQVVDGKMKVTF